MATKLLPLSAISHLPQRNRNSFRHFPILLLIATAVAHGQTPALVDQTWAILQPGDSVGTPMLIKPMQGDAQWLALVARAHRWKLEPVQRAGEGKGLEDYPAKAPEGTLALLRYPSLKVGPAPTPEMRFSGHPREFGPGSSPLQILFGAHAYDVEVHDDAVWLRRGTVQTQIGEARDDADMGYLFRVQIIWAGDLDRDGRLDMITKEKNGGYSDDLCLYLSSAAHTGQSLIEKVACEDWSG